MTDDFLRLQGEAMALYDLGQKDESAAVLQQLHEVVDEFVETHDAELDKLDLLEANWPDGFAQAYAWTGNADEAFRYLRVLAGTGSAALGGLASSPYFVRLHDDPRWHPFLEEFGRSPEQLAKIAFSPQLPDEIRRGN